MTTCSHCGRLRRGTDLAAAANRFWCHGMFDDEPTCYQTVILGGEPDGRHDTTSSLTAEC
jgi:hypothetical protein